MLEQIYNDPLGFVCLITGLICAALIIAAHFIEQVNHWRIQRLLDARNEALTQALRSTLHNKDNNGQDDK